MERETQSKIASIEPLVSARRLTAIGKPQTRSQSKAGRGTFPADSPVKEVWGRINIDIATFLAAMEALSTDDSEENYQALLEATDRLLWGSARTRLELERVLAGTKRGQTIRRISG